MRHVQPSTWAIALFASLTSCAAVSSARAATVTITPFKDNSLFESIGAEQSSGIGSLYAGVLGGSGGDLRRRAVLAFDLATVPAGATITGASLQLRASKVSPTIPNETYTLHRLTANWGEGTSSSVGGHGANATTNDATWIHPFFGSAATWATQGGDFSATTSASKAIANIGFYTFSDAQLTADVQSWFAGSTPNFGWILIGDETTVQDAKQFDSRESTSANRPALTITYSVPEPGALGLVGLAAVAGLCRRRSRQNFCEARKHIVE